MTDHSQWGRVGEDGTIFLRMPDGEERRVGQWAAGDPSAGIAHFSRKYSDLVVEVDLAARRLKGGLASPEQVEAVCGRLKDVIAEPAFLGDIKALSDKTDALLAAAARRRTELTEKREQVRKETAQKRADIAAEAERLASSTQWKSTHIRFRELLDEWKALPRNDKATEKEAWKRFSKARSEFDKGRRVHLAELAEVRERAGVVKDGIVSRAEALASSTDWAETSRTFRGLMDEWKAAPRADRDEDQLLWTRFRAAQDTFFKARNAVNAKQNAVEVENLAAKLALVEQAEALVPVKDEKRARDVLRTVQDKWEDIGPVPRSDRSAVERRLRVVESKIREAENERWRRTDPAALARAQATADQFQSAIERLEVQIGKAVAAGDERKAADLGASLDNTRSLLAAAQSAVAEYSGGS
ncbi:MAG: DUF349 domain-containing protein [Candidatus Nanopelagicales bacterium]|nr:DUF349 domain-containing protein [Candidatus Nanopelagicales bacterium]